MLLSALELALRERIGEEGQRTYKKEGVTLDPVERESAGRQRGWYAWRLCLHSGNV